MLIQREKLETHFSEHFASCPYVPQPELEHPEEYPHLLPPDDLPESTPSPREVGKCMKRLKNGRCQGTDGVYAEQLKYSDSVALLEYITLLVVMIWSCLQVPKNWLSASITCLYKRGLKSLAENYRGLSIIATLSKVVSGIIVERIRQSYESILLPSQFGFRANKSTCDAIFILRQILKTSKKSKKPLYVAFIDLKAAYDWIPRSALFQCLNIRLRCPRLVAILRALYTGTKACIKGSTNFFDTLVGCRQGAMESPLIFNVYMDFVVRVARSEIIKSNPEAGFKITYCMPNEVSPRELRKKASSYGHVQLTELLYADDQVIFASSLKDLQNMLTIYDDTFRRFGLQISYKKTETMAFNVDEHVMELPSLVSIGSNHIKNVRSFKYLGYTITNTENSSQSLHARIGAAYQKWNDLKYILTDRRIRLSTRVKFLTTCIRSRLLYCIQAWELTEKELGKVEVIWHSFLRKMVRRGFERKNAPDRAECEGTDVDWSYRISNDRLRTITKTRPIRDFCLAQHLKYLAHICRLDNNALQKQVLFDTMTPRTMWNRIEKILGVDVQQARKMMMAKTDFLRLMDTRFHQERPEVVHDATGEIR